VKGAMQNRSIFHFSFEICHLPFGFPVGLRAIAQRFRGDSRRETPRDSHEKWQMRNFK
jgi:hypothetical protein